MTRLDWALTHNVPHSVVRIAGDVVSILSLGLWTPRWADRFSDWRYMKAVNSDIAAMDRVTSPERQVYDRDDWDDENGVIFEPVEYGWVQATIAGRPSIITVGRNQAEALSMVEDALNEYAEFESGL